MSAKQAETIEPWQRAGQGRRKPAVHVVQAAPETPKIMAARLVWRGGSGEGEQVGQRREWGKARARLLSGKARRRRTNQLGAFAEQ